MGSANNENGCFSKNIQSETVKSHMRMRLFLSCFLKTLLANLLKLIRWAIFFKEALIFSVEQLFLDSNLNSKVNL